MKATDVLREEHEVIQQVLDCVEVLAQRAEKSGELDLASARRALDFLGTFADRCHHGKEEQGLFPLLNLKGLPKHVGPIAVMLAEHDQGRAAIRGMRDALQGGENGKPGAARDFAGAARAYVDLLRQHIDKENGVLFPMADQMLGEPDQRALLGGFDKLEAGDLGAGTHERYLALARDLCTRLGVAWRPHATVPHACCGNHSGCG
jgi:hemerythrin-like domain-containing protein